MILIRADVLATSLIRTIETEDQSRRLPHVRIAEMTEKYDWKGRTKSKYTV